MFIVVFPFISMFSRIVQQLVENTGKYRKKLEYKYKIGYKGFTSQKE